MYLPDEVRVCGETVLERLVADLEELRPHLTESTKMGAVGYVMYSVCTYF